jgi:hypothetical protein
MEAGLSRIRQLRRRLGRPHWVVLDEAHYSLHGEGIRPEAIDLEAKGFCLATYRSSWLRDSVVKAIDVVVLARTAAVDELAFLRSAFAGPAAPAERAIAVLPELPRGEFLVLQPNGPSEPRAFFPAPRAMRHVRHLRKYADSVTSPERRFFFRHPGGRVVGTADSLNSFRQAVAAAEDAVLAHHARRGDFSRWVLDTFSDRELGVQLRKTEARWRRGGGPRSPPGDRSPDRAPLRPGAGRRMSAVTKPRDWPGQPFRLMPRATGVNLALFSESAVSGPTTNPEIGAGWERLGDVRTSCDTGGRHGGG